MSIQSQMMRLLDKPDHLEQSCEIHSYWHFKEMGLFFFKRCGQALSQSAMKHWKKGSYRESNFKVDLMTRLPAFHLY